MLKIKDIEKFESCGFVENVNLRQKDCKYYCLQGECENCRYYVDLFFVVYNDGTLSFDTSAYPLQEYEIYDIVNVIYEMMIAGLLEKVEDKGE